jgi:hypothetical protein
MLVHKGISIRLHSVTPQTTVHVKWFLEYYIIGGKGGGGAKTEKNVLS